MKEKLTDIHRDILKLDLHLESRISTTLWVSDLHGEGKRFVNILKGRFGLLYRTCIEALPQTLGEANINYLSKVIRNRAYLETPGIKLQKQDVALCLVQILKHKIKGRLERITEQANADFKEIVIRLIFDESVPDIVFEHDTYLDGLISEICKLIMQNILDHIVVLGDILDRGGEPDKIIRILNLPQVRKNMTLIYGNHDLLWMGACAGNRSLIAEALRITCRYDHMAFLERMKIDFGKLKDFALRTYPPDGIRGRYKAKTPEGRAMEKALSVIQFKLEEKTIKAFPEFDMGDRLWLEKLSKKIKTGDTEGITDTNLPTLDLDNPSELSPEEKFVTDDLALQFTTNPCLKYYIGFFFKEGKMYHVYNNILNIHALIPSTKTGEFETVFGKKGKELFDYLDGLIRDVGKNYLNGDSQDERDLAKLFYLWCGPKSPLFGKDAMKTFERYFFSDKDTHKETTLYWEKNLLDPAFQALVQNEFMTKRVIFGHVPRNHLKGQTMAIGDGFAINVDGGFAEAYYHRGHALVHTPRQLYGIILPTPEELSEANQKRLAAPIKIEIIEDYNYPQKAKDTIFGKHIKKKRDALFEEMLLAEKNG